jgi:drug/metabolite transporter (DMT)-like permease
MIATRPRDLFLLVGITFIWGFNLITSKVGVNEIPPVLFTFLRFAIVALALAPMLRVQPGQMSAVVVAALLSGALHFALNFAALRRSNSVSSVAIASQLGVPFATLLSVALLGESVRWRRWTGIALSFVGVGIMGFDPQIGERWESLALVVACVRCRRGEPHRAHRLFSSGAAVPGHERGAAHDVVARVRRDLQRHSAGRPAHGPHSRRWRMHARRC